MSRTFDSPLHTTDQSIDRVLNAGLPVVLVFTDVQTQPPLQQAIDSLAKQYAGQLLVVKVATGDSPQSIQRYQVGGFPAVVTAKKGEVQSKEERITSSDLETHAAFLLGKGPRPQPSAARQTAQQGAAGNGRPVGSQPYNGADGGQTAAGGRPVAVNDMNFEQEVMRSPTPVLVDFWAEWCGPCRMMEPTLQKLAGELSGRLKVAKLNVDENRLTGGRFGVQAIPTMMIVQNGRILDRWSGAMPEATLRSRLAPYLR